MTSLTYFFSRASSVEDRLASNRGGGQCSGSASPNRVPCKHKLREFCGTASALILCITALEKEPKVCWIIVSNEGVAGLSGFASQLSEEVTDISVPAAFVQTLTGRVPEVAIKAPTDSEITAGVLVFLQLLVRPKAESKTLVPERSSLGEPRRPSSQASPRLAAQPWASPRAEHCRPNC